MTKYEKTDVSCLSHLTLSYLDLSKFIVHTLFNYCVGTQVQRLVQKQTFRTPKNSPSHVSALQSSLSDTCILQMNFFNYLNVNVVCKFCLEADIPFTGVRFPV